MISVDDPPPDPARRPTDDASMCSAARGSTRCHARRLKRPDRPDRPEDTLPRRAGPRATGPAPPSRRPESGATARHLTDHLLGSERSPRFPKRTVFSPASCFPEIGCGVRRLRTNPMNPPAPTDFETLGCSTGVPHRPGLGGGVRPRCALRRAKPFARRKSFPGRGLSNGLRAHRPDPGPRTVGSGRAHSPPSLPDPARDAPSAPATSPARRPVRLDPVRVARSEAICSAQLLAGKQTRPNAIGAPARARAPYRRGTEALGPPIIVRPRPDPIESSRPGVSSCFGS